MIQRAVQGESLSESLLVIYLIQLLNNPTEPRIEMIEALVDIYGDRLTLEQFRAEFPYLTDEEYGRAEYILQPAMTEVLSSEAETRLIRVRQLLAA